MPLRPISFLSSLSFSCAWSHFIELAVAGITAPIVQPCFFLLLSFSHLSVLAFSRMLLLSHKTPGCSSAKWIPRSHEPKKKRIAQRTSTHEKRLRATLYVFQFLLFSLLLHWFCKIIPEHTGPFNTRMTELGLFWLSFF